MRLRRFTTLAAAPLVTLAALAAPAGASEIAVEGQAGYRDLAFKNTAQALFDSSGGGTFGGALRYTFWRGAFASVGFRTEAGSVKPCEKRRAAAAATCGVAMLVPSRPQ